VIGFSCCKAKPTDPDHIALLHWRDGTAASSGLKATRDPLHVDSPFDAEETGYHLNATQRAHGDDLLLGPTPHRRPSKPWPNIAQQTA
jgi:hypothetical protein